jgi:hypothetical protein
MCLLVNFMYTEMIWDPAANQLGILTMFHTLLLSDSWLHCRPKCAEIVSMRALSFVCWTGQLICGRPSIIRCAYRLPTFHMASPWWWCHLKPLNRLLDPYFSLVASSGKLLWVLASTVIFDSESCGTHDHILPSHDSGSCTDVIHWALTLVCSLPFNLIRLVRLARSFNPCIQHSQDHRNAQTLSPRQGKGPTTLERATGI